MSYSVFKFKPDKCLKVFGYCRKILDGIFEVCGVAEDMFRYFKSQV